MIQPVIIFIIFAHNLNKNFKHNTMNIPFIFWLVPVASVVALSMAWYFFQSMMKYDEGTPRMREIHTAPQCTVV